MTAHLRVPELAADVAMGDAAVLYAEAGWFVLPIDQGVKHAGSVLGRGWPEKSSREPAVVRAWFQQGGYGLAIHVGRSGALAFDVDDPVVLPKLLAVHLRRHQGPYQSTRRGVDGRGHYLYQQPSTRTHGNGRGSLQGRWGDVRGLNGILVVEPTPHRNSEGQYRWLRTGLVPALPAELDAALLGPSPRRARTAPKANRPALIGSPRERSRRPPRTLPQIVQSIMTSDQRNNAVFEAACRAGELVARGTVPRARAEQILLEAGRAVGLSDVELCGHDGRSGTVASGLRTGIDAVQRRRL